MHKFFVCLIILIVGSNPSSPDIALTTKSTLILFLIKKSFRLKNTFIFLSNILLYL